MYGTFVLLEDDGAVERGKRITLGEAPGKDEAWLRDTLFDHPEIIPVADIDPTFGELVPLCTELRTEAGPVDAVFINEHGRLTIVECKLWNNPEARRKVVAQALDYVSAISKWSYADLQRQVSIATGKQGNVPFDAVRQHCGDELGESAFVDAVSRSLREGRFLVLIAGDGIREGVQSLTELVSRNATKAFSFALVEVAIYQFTDGRIAIQPRVLVETEVIERQFIVVNSGNGAGTVVEASDDVEDEPRRRGERLHLKDWWQPILAMKFDDPEQEPPYWVVTNNVVLNTPYPGIVIKAWSSRSNSGNGIFIGQNRKGALEAVGRFIKRDAQELAAALPEGTLVDPKNDSIQLRNDDLGSDAEKYAWIKENLKSFANVLRPRLRKWHLESAV